jgi:hypothetical protein
VIVFTLLSASVARAQDCVHPLEICWSPAPGASSYSLAVSITDPTPGAVAWEYYVPARFSPQGSAFAEELSLPIGPDGAAATVYRQILCGVDLAHEVRVVAAGPGWVAAPSEPAVDRPLPLTTVCQSILTVPGEIR